MKQCPAVKKALQKAGTKGSAGKSEHAVQDKKLRSEARDNVGKKKEGDGRDKKARKASVAKPAASCHGKHKGGSGSGRETAKKKDSSAPKKVSKKWTDDPYFLKQAANLFSHVHGYDNYVTGHSINRATFEGYSEEYQDMLDNLDFPEDFEETKLVDYDEEHVIDLTKDDSGDNDEDKK
jgi:hypothetical protein